MTDSPKLPRNTALIIGGILSSIASLIHLGSWSGDPDWYRFFGAGEEMAQMAARGELYPALVSTGIAIGLAIWAAYAFAGAGLIRRLPFMRLCLAGISAIYLARGIFGIFAVLLVDNPYMLELREKVVFVIVSSVIVLIYGLVYAVGTAQVWPELSPKKSETE